jgi:hypothetical protein
MPFHHRSFRILNCLCPFIYFFLSDIKMSPLSQTPRTCSNSWAMHELVIRRLKTIISISLYFPLGTILLKSFLFLWVWEIIFFYFVRLLLFLNICIEQNDFEWIDLTMHSCTILEQMVNTLQFKSAVCNFENYFSSVFFLIFS